MRAVPFAALLLATAVHAQTADTFAGELVEPGRISTAANEYNYSETRDGSLRVFARSPAGFEHARIFVSECKAGVCGEPSRISFSDDRYRDSDPFLSADGATLYFISDRPTAKRPAKKDLDLWRAQRIDGAWRAPEHLGDAVNREGDELGPELHGDTLYFNASQADGTLRIYMSTLRPDGFSAPEALPSPINAGRAQGDFTFSPDGTVAMFWSERDGKAGLYAASHKNGAFGAAVRLDGRINAPGFNFTPWFSPDGKWLYFASMWKKANGGAHAALFNGQSNIFRVPAGLAMQALKPGE
jgi:Tol biopolymer transport system component